MSNEDQMRKDLLDKIKTRRVSINTFVKKQEPRGVRLSNLSIFSSAIVTALTAGPALGGTKFTDAASKLLILPNNLPMWQLLCLAAMILSIVSAVSANIYKSNELATRVSKAEISNAALEGLEALVEFGQLSVSDAVKLYQQYVNEIPFVQQ